ncbi:G1/S-specific cyclin CCN1 [Spathaspora sp. JA1]|nr:G1/S-specific cyclin CCN1 [Spathaspora sp. JA1]
MSLSFPVKYGPPSHIKPKPYHIMLELLESQANKKLMGEYLEDTTLTMAAFEPLAAVNPAMIDLQPEIQWFMRPFLLDFLIELHSSFKLQPHTLFLSLNIIDRYCAKRIVFKRHYQLVGCTALWIAGKYEDKKSRVPTLKELTIMCRNAYDEEMFIQMERHILSTLEWSLSYPNLEDCLQLAIQCSHVSNVTPCKYKYNESTGGNSNNSTVSAITAVGRFLCELSLYDKYFLSVTPSLVGIAANLLACSMLKIPDASNALRALIRKVADADDSEDEDDESFYDDNIENRRPNVIGPFLGGLDDESLFTVKKIALMLLIQLSKVTDVLSKKYEPLGVIQVINNFHSRYVYLIQQLYENQDSIVSNVDSINAKTVSIVEVLLQFPQDDEYPNNYCDMLAPRVPQSPFAMDVGPAPLTPPSATSQYSVFSSKSGGGSNSSTPTHASVASFGAGPIRTKSKIMKRKEYSPMKSVSSPLVPRQV